MLNEYPETRAQYEMLSRNMAPGTVLRSNTGPASRALHVERRVSSTAPPPHAYQKEQQQPQPQSQQPMYEVTPPPSYQVGYPPDMLKQLSPDLANQLSQGNWRTMDGQPVFPIQPQQQRGSIQQQGFQPARHQSGQGPLRGNNNSTMERPTRLGYGGGLSQQYGQVIPENEVMGHPGADATVNPMSRANRSGHASNYASQGRNFAQSNPQQGPPSTQPPFGYSHANQNHMIQQQQQSRVPQSYGVGVVQPPINGNGFHPGPSSQVSQGFQAPSSGSNLDMDQVARMNSSSTPQPYNAVGVSNSYSV